MVWVVPEEVLQSGAARIQVVALEKLRGVGELRLIEHAPEVRNVACDYSRVVGVVVWRALAWLRRETESLQEE